MKKSEKIESRLSPEEKDQLAKRAEAEGLPVSEVVRKTLGQSGDGLQLDGATTHAANPWLSRGAWFFLGLVTATLAVLSLVFAPFGRDRVEGWSGRVMITDRSTVKVEEGRNVSQVRRESTRISGDFFLLAEPGASTKLSLEDGSGGRYEVVGLVGDAGDGMLDITFNVCRRQSDTCLFDVAPSVSTQPREELDLIAQATPDVQVWVDLDRPTTE
ncbi:MAG: hypothetical protein HRU11_00635 [Parvularculaceae bacterium]|nr:hypothetical protein [Parvularculaceae bacterium]